jgi:ABC-type transport system involved in multi-copper enzyme maturation permease subunit
MIAMYLIDALANIVDGLNAIRPVSLFKYYAAHDPLRYGLNPGDCAVLIGVTIVFLVVSLVAFERRDLSV